MAEKTTTTREEKDSQGNKSREQTETQRDDSGVGRRPANPSAPGQDTHKTGPGSGTNPTGIGGNEESVSG